MARTRMWPLRHVVTRYLNPLIRPLAGWLPGFGVLTFRGRRTNRTYRIPVNVFRRGDAFLFVLTYGSDAEWVKNVLAAGEASIRVRATSYHLAEPELLVDPSRHLAPLPVRLIGRLDNVTEFLRMRRS